MRKFDDKDIHCCQNALLSSLKHNRISNTMYLLKGYEIKILCPEYYDVIKRYEIFHIVSFIIICSQIHFVCPIKVSYIFSLGGVWGRRGSTHIEYETINYLPFCFNSEAEKLRSNSVLWECIMNL